MVAIVPSVLWDVILEAIEIFITKKNDVTSRNLNLLLSRNAA
jgi:hypothetical protein